MDKEDLTIKHIKINLGSSTNIEATGKVETLTKNKMLSPLIKTAKNLVNLESSTKMSANLNPISNKVNNKALSNNLLNKILESKESKLKIKVEVIATSLNVLYKIILI